MNINPPNDTFEENDAFEEMDENELQLLSDDDPDEGNIHFLFSEIGDDKRKRPDFDDENEIENDKQTTLTEQSVDSSGNVLKKDTGLVTYKKKSYKEVEYEIYNDYFDVNEYHSCALDILATYLKGQKLIYMESKAYCEFRLNILMMPSIFLSTIAIVLSAVVNRYKWGAYLIAGINGIISFLLAVVNYLKLDAASEAHKISSHQYDKLQTSVEFLSGTTLLFKDAGPYGETDKSPCPARSL
jgi:hypothetical protein